MTGVERYSPPSNLGVLTASLISAVGTMVAANLSLLGNRGGLPSVDSLLALTVFAFLLRTDLSRRMASALLQNGNTLMVIAFGALLLAGALRAHPNVAVYLVQSHLVEILRWSTLGFLAMSGVRFLGSAKGGNRRSESVGTVALVATLTLWATGLLLAMSARASIRIDIFLIVSGDAAYYQLLGDSYIVVAGLALGLQAQWLRSRPRAAWWYGAFALHVGLQGVGSFLLLQLYGSNKAPVVVLGMCFTALYVARPTPLVLPGWRFPVRGLRAVWSVMVVLAVVSLSLYSVELPPLRIFGFWEGTGVLESSSVLSRNSYLREVALDHLTDSPIFGNASIGILSGGYLHTSILSLQSHLGVVGTLTLGIATLVGWRRASGRAAASWLRVMFLPVVAVSMVSSFFSWGPLWFVLGGLVALPVPERMNRPPAAALPSRD